MKLNDATTLLMMPFYFKDGVCLPAKDSIWKPCKMALDKGKLYAHIQKFMLARHNDEPGSNYQYLFYSLSDESKDAEAIKKMILMPMAIMVKQSDGRQKAIIFQVGQAELSKKEREEAKRYELKINAEKAAQEAEKHPADEKLCKKAKEMARIAAEPVVFEETKESFFSPKLLICPQAEIGMLILSVKLNNVPEERKRDDGKIERIEKNYLLENLITLNYSLFKTYSKKEQDKPIYTQTQANILMADDELTQENLDEKRRKMLSGILQGQRKSLPEKLSKIDNALPNRIKAESEETEMASWTMAELVVRLMQEFEGRYCRFDPFRMHVLTYMQLPQECFSEELLDNYVRVMRVQNRKYQVLKASGGPTLYTQTFENIFMGASVEGGCMMTLLPRGEVDEEDMKFIRDFKDDALKCYLWIYVMVLMQRHTLVNMERKMTEWDFKGENTSDKRTELRQLINQITLNKVNTHFADVSDHIQHNQFYALCCTNLMIAQHFDDVSKKLEMLKEYLRIQIDEESIKQAKEQKIIQQQLLNQQRIAEEKRRDDETKKENKRMAEDKRFNRILGYVSIFAVFSVVWDICSIVMKAVPCLDSPWTAVFFIAIGIVVSVTFYCKIKNYKQEIIE